jgi:hypothetical protein
LSICTKWVVVVVAVGWGGRFFVSTAGRAQRLFSFLPLLNDFTSKIFNMRPTFAGPGSSTGNYKPTSDPGKQVGAFQKLIHSGIV